MKIARSAELRRCFCKYAPLKNTCRTLDLSLESRDSNLDLRDFRIC